MYCISNDRLSLQEDGMDCISNTINHTLNCFSNHFFLCPVMYYASLSHCPCDKNMINFPCIGWVIRCLELIRSTGSSRHIQMKIWEGCCFYKVLIIHPSLIWMLRSSDSDAWQVSNNKRVLWKEGPRISGSEEDRRPRPRTDTIWVMGRHNELWGSWKLRKKIFTVHLRCWSGDLSLCNT